MSSSSELYFQSTYAKKINSVTGKQSSELKLFPILRAAAFNCRKIETLYSAATGFQDLTLFARYPEIEDDNRDFLIQDNSFFLKFSPKLKPVKLEPGLIPPLLRRVRGICDFQVSPAGRPGCRDCSILEELLKSCGSIFSSLEQDLIRSLDAEHHNGRPQRPAERPA